MVNVAVYAMQFATGPELPRELSLRVGVGDPRGDQNKNMAFSEFGCGKVEVPYALNGQCSSICDAICVRTGVAPGFVL